MSSTILTVTYRGEEYRCRETFFVDARRRPRRYRTKWVSKSGYWIGDDTGMRLLREQREAPERERQAKEHAKSLGQLVRELWPECESEKESP